jgi:hypothetical protein
VRVLAVSLRAAAGEVLRHARDARRAQLSALEATDVGRSQSPNQIEILAERADGTRPPRLGRDVSHRVQCNVDTDGAILLPGDRAELLHEFLVTDRPEPDRLRPLRERPGAPTRRRILVERVARIG